MYFCGVIHKPFLLHAFMLNHFSRVWFFVIVRTVAPLGSSVHGDTPGKNTGVDYHTLLQGIFPPRDWTHISCGSCIASRFFTTEPLKKSSYFIVVYNSQSSPLSILFSECPCEGNRLLSPQLYRWECWDGISLNYLPKFKFISLPPPFSVQKLPRIQ